MRELQVPKRRVDVELVLVDGERRLVTVFLADKDPRHGGRERVSDLLSRDEPFFPAFDHASQGMTFVNRVAVATAKVAREVELEPGDAEELTIPTEHEVEVTLLRGELLRGLVSYVLPPERSRLVDYLNDLPAFFRLSPPANAVLLVNKQQVARVALVTR